MIANPKFQDFSELILAPDSNMDLLIGKPGCGKSKMIENLLEQACNSGLKSTFIGTERFLQYYIKSFKKFPNSSSLLELVSFSKIKDTLKESLLEVVSEGDIDILFIDNFHDLVFKEPDIATFLKHEILDSKTKIIASARTRTTQIHDDFSDDMIHVLDSDKLVYNADRIFLLTVQDELEDETFDFGENEDEKIDFTQPEDLDAVFDKILAEQKEENKLAAMEKEGSNEDDDDFDFGQYLQEASGEEFMIIDVLKNRIESLPIGPWKIHIEE